LDNSRRYCDTLHDDEYYFLNADPSFLLKSIE
jgi:hypothetical protein